MVKTWDDKARQRGVSRIPTISTEALSRSFRFITIDKIGLLRENIYRRLRMGFFNNNKVKRVQIPSFVEETFKYVFASQITSTSESSDIEEFLIQDHAELDQKFGRKWWSRSFGKHSSCSNVLCKHKQVAQVNFPIRVVYYYDTGDLTLYFSYRVLPYYVPLTATDATTTTTTATTATTTTSSPTNSNIKYEIKSEPIND